MVNRTAKMMKMAATVIALLMIALARVRRCWIWAMVGARSILRLILCVARRSLLRSCRRAFSRVGFWRVEAGGSFFGG